MVFLSPCLVKNSGVPAGMNRFFVLGVIVFPALFLIGAAASVILILKEKMRKNADK